MPLALLFATPLVQMVLSSLKTNAEIRRFPPTLLPRDPTLSGFVQLFTESDVLRWIANSVLVASCAVLAQVLLCSVAGKQSFVICTITFADAADLPWAIGVLRSISNRHG